MAAVEGIVVVQESEVPDPPVDPKKVESGCAAEVDGSRVVAEEPADLRYAVEHLVRTRRRRGARWFGPIDPPERRSGGSLGKRRHARTLEPDDRPPRHGHDRRAEDEPTDHTDPHQSLTNRPSTCAVWITDGRYTR